MHNVYDTVRYSIAVISFGLLAIVYFIILKKRKFVPFLIFSIVLFAVFEFLWFTPFENLFLRFSSIDQSVSYSFSSSSIVQKMPYEGGDAILYRDSDNDLQLSYIEKDNRGWKTTCPNYINMRTKIVLKFMSTIQTIKMPDSDLTFVSVMYNDYKRNQDYGSSIIKSLHDSNGSTFSGFKVDDGAYDQYNYYTFTNTNNSSYKITINDIDYSLNN